MYVYKAIKEEEKETKFKKRVEQERKKERKLEKDGEE
jgi:hypothetical protein